LIIREDENPTGSQPKIGLKRCFYSFLYRLPKFDFRFFNSSQEEHQMLVTNHSKKIKNCSQLFGWRFSMRAILMFTFLLGVFAVFKTPVFSQSNVTGGFEGRVIDGENGPGLGNISVQFINLANGYQTAKRTNAEGYFQQDFLSPGVYTIKVEATGYEVFEKKQELYATRSNRFVPIPIALRKIGAAATSTNTPVNPNPTGTTTTTTSTTTSSVQNDDDAQSDEDAGASNNPRRDGAFNIRELLSLPLGSTTLTRSFDELAFLVPGVYLPPQAIGNSVGPGVGGGVGTSGQFSVNGLRSRANNFTVDGSDNNDEDIGVRRQGFFTLVPQPVESVQEFQIITLLAPAQYGRNLGAQVNALSRSGGNDFRGTIYGMLNSDRLNARNFFDNVGGDSTIGLRSFRPGGTSVPVFVNGQSVQVTNDAGEKDPLTLLQGGFAFGGPLVRDKMFFFASAEGQFLNGTRERNFAVPTLEQRGLFNSGSRGLQQCQPPNVFSNGACRDEDGDPVNFARGFPTSSSGDTVFSLFPFPNNPNGIYGQNTYTQELSADARGRIISGKFDYNFGFRNRPQTFTARYNYTDDWRDLTDVGGAIFSAIRPVVRTDNISTYWTGGLTDNVSNEFRFSWGRTRLRFDELPDTTGFLRPVTRVTNAEEAQFLLNAPVLFNVTLPVSCTPTGCLAGNSLQYTRAGTTENSYLGPVGQVIISGFSPVGVDVFNFPQQRRNNTFQFADTVRWQVGQQSIAFGTDIRRIYLDSNLPRNSRPLVSFNGGIRIDEDNFIVGFVNPIDLAAAGAASGSFQTLVTPGNNAEINLSYTQFNFFVQDDWRARSNLNISFGLRYEFNTTPKEADRKIEDTFGITPPSFLSGLTDIIDGRSKIYDADKNNFAPRFGFAYAPTSSTVIRGGAGVYYDQIIGSVVSQSRNVFPTFVTNNFGGGLVIDNGFFTMFNPRNAIFDPSAQIVCNSFDQDIPCNRNISIPLIQPGTLNTINPNLTQQQLNAALLDIFRYFPGVGNGSPFGVTLPTRQLDTPLSYQYSIGIEQKLFRNTFLSVAYVGTTGRSLLRFTTPNLGSNYVVGVEGINLSDDCADNGSGCEPVISGTTYTPNFSVPFQGVGPVNRFETTGRSRYDSLQIGLRGRLTNSFQYQVGYVYGKVKDDVSDVFDLAGAFSLPQNSLTFEGEYAPANFDVRHRFTYNFIYDLPDFNGRGSFVRYLFGGWQIAGTGKFQTGQPFTVNSIFDVNLDGNLTDRLDNTQFITQGDSRLRPLSLGCTGTQCQAMLADFGEDGAIGRNSFRAGSILELDLSFSKRFRITENQNLQFRMDVFNFTNRANFGVPVRLLESPGFGQANDTVTPGRRIQFALKYNF
jgi:hypothetical protein